jgi:hypothetical protein
VTGKVRNALSHAVDLARNIHHHCKLAASSFLSTVMDMPEMNPFTEETPSLTSLPQDILLEILTHLASSNPNDVLRLRQVGWL